MSAADTVKEFVRIANTAGLAKDVVDLLQAKVALLADKVAALEKDGAALTDENTALLRENRNLKLENENLQKQLQNARPKGEELDEICNKMLISLANYRGRDGITSNELIQHLGLPKAKGDYLFDQLVKRKFVATGAGVIGRGMFWCVTSAGREYMAKAGLL